MGDETHSKSTDDAAFTRGLPKAELHIHVEGSLEPELMFELAARNRIRLPYRCVEQVRKAYAFRDLQSFLDIYYAGAAVLRTERDFFDLTRAYLERARADGVRHAEIFFDPQTHIERGVAIETVIDGMRAAIDDVGRPGRVSALLIPCFLRHLSAGSAMTTLEALLTRRDDIVAIGLDSSERDNPPERFAAVFERGRAEGLRAVAHAGEEGPAQYIRSALDTLGAERIDHGVRCVEDPDLMRRLAREKVPLTVCPLSNVALRVFGSMAQHNLPTLLEAGLMVTVNSDDPAYFGGYIAENYAALSDPLGLSREAIASIARNSFEASFLPPAHKRVHCEEIDAFLSAG